MLLLSCQKFSIWSKKTKKSDYKYKLLIENQNLLHKYLETWSYYRTYNITLWEFTVCSYLWYLLHASSWWLCFLLFLFYFELVAVFVFLSFMSKHKVNIVQYGSGINHNDEWKVNFQKFYVLVLSIYLLIMILPK